jgi:predicted dehydrogenase
MNTVRYGVIGVGNMGTTHALSVARGEVPGLSLVAVADHSEARRAWAKANLPPETLIYHDGMELIKSGKVDAVHIAVPHYQHPELAIAALNAGLHVMVEKPAGVYTKQVREMNEVAASHPDLVFAMMFNQRTNCLYRKMHELVQGGELGAIRRVNWIITDWFRTQAYYDSGDWRATWNGEGGGVLLNQCPHQLDLLQWICGMPSKVRAFCHNGMWHDVEVEDDVTACLEYAGADGALKATGVFVTTTGDACGDNRFEVTCDKGKLICEHDTLTLYRLEMGNAAAIRTVKDGFAHIKTTVENVETDGENPQHNGVLRAFAGRILRGEPLVAEGREGVNGLTLSNAMHLSSWLGRPVDIPFDEDLFLAELDKRRRTSRHKTGTGVTFDTEGSY